MKLPNFITPKEISELTTNIAKELEKLEEASSNYIEKPKIYRSIPGPERIIGDDITYFFTLLCDKNITWHSIADVFSKLYNISTEQFIETVLSNFDTQEEEEANSILNYVITHGYHVVGLTTVITDYVHCLPKYSVLYAFEINKDLLNELKPKYVLC